MKKLSVLVVMVLAVSAAMGQKAGKGMHQGKQHVQMLDSIVDLTDDQEVKVQAIHDKYRDSMMAARQSQDHEKMQRIRKTMHNEVMAVLTPEQQTKLNVHRKEQREKMRTMHAEIRKLHEEKVDPQMQAKRNAFEKELTDAEKATIVKAREQMKAFREKMMADSMADMPGPMPMGGPMHALTNDVKASLKPIVEAHDSSLRPILVEMRTLHKGIEPEVKAIKAKYLTKDHPGMQSGQPGKPGPGKGQGVKQGQGPNGGQGKGQSGQWMAYYFLLMEAE